MRCFARILVAILLVAVFSGPLVMALDGCLAMCETSCALTCATVVSVPTLAPPLAVSDGVALSTVSFLAPPPTVLKPPPKLAALSL
jgi:hypothetical protein